MADSRRDAPEASPHALRDVLLGRYDALIKTLTRKLGSKDRADDALQDAWLRLERTQELGVVHDPFAYVLRVAVNLGGSQRRSEARRSAILGTRVFSDLADGLADEAPDPERVAAARSEWSAIKRALLSLPERRRQIVLAAWSEGIAHEALAARHGVSVRTIQIEIKRALEHVAARVGRQ